MINYYNTFSAEESRSIIIGTRLRTDRNIATILPEVNRDREDLEEQED